MKKQEQQNKEWQDHYYPEMGNKMPGDFFEQRLPDEPIEQESKLTAEEILANQIFRTKCDFTDEEYWHIYRAMEQCARQKPDLRKELIKYNIWLDSQFQEETRFINEIVDQYLESRQ